MKTLPDRSEVKKEDTWNLEALYSDGDDWKRDFDLLDSRINKISSYRGRLSESPDVLYSCLSEIDDIKRFADKIFVYAHLLYDQDTTNNESSGKLEMITGLISRMSGELSFVVPEILCIDESKMNEFLQDDKLKFYDFYLREIIRLRPHTLTPSEEKLLALASDPLGGGMKIFSILNNGDIRFPSIVNEDGEQVLISHSRYSTFLMSPNRDIRKTSFEKYMGVYKDYKNSFAGTLGNHVKSSVFKSRARHYSSSREHYLNYDNVGVDIYDNIIKAVENRLDSLHRYCNLRKKVLNVDDLHLYDMYVPLVSEFDKKYSFDEAQEIVINSVSKMGDEYSSIYCQGLKDRWVDKYENKGKRSGAFSFGCYDSYPYVLLNFNGSLNSVFTLAHEMGHSMHTYYTNHNQPYTYSLYKIFVAEVASLTNEALLYDYLINRVESKDEKLFLVNHELEKIRGTLFRQCMFAAFERDMFQASESGQPLTAKFLSDSYHNLNKKWFGPDVVIDELIDYEWARIPHFYYNFYVYKYCIGISCANTLAKKIINSESGAVDRYINNFLKAGGSNYPVDILKSAGVDISTPRPIEDTADLFDSLLKEFESLIS